MKMMDRARSFFGRIGNMLSGNVNEGKLEEIFGVPVIQSWEMDESIRLWDSIYSKKPPWVENNEEIETLSFAKVICTETAKLVLEEADFSFEGGSRADLIEERIKKDLSKTMRRYLEYSCALGTIIAIPSGQGVRFITPDNFFPTSVGSDQEIDGGYATITVRFGKKYYIRAMYMRFEGEEFVITNRAFESETGNYVGKEVDLISVPEWKDIQPEVRIKNIDRPLFAVLKMPFANGVDKESPLGVSLFFDVVEQIKSLDVAYSKMMREIRLSDKLIFISDFLLDPTGGSKVTDATKYREQNFPDHTLNLPGATDAKEMIHEYNPQLNTETRLAGIKHLIALIGYGCGYSQGYFSFDESRGLLTATQVEAEDKRTIELISDIRSNCISPFIEHIAYIYDTMISLYTNEKAGKWEFKPHFKDITISFNEDRLRILELMRAGFFPRKMYFELYENFDKKQVEELLAQLEEEKKKDLKLEGMFTNAGATGNTDGSGGGASGD